MGTSGLEPSGRRVRRRDFLRWGVAGAVGIPLVPGARTGPRALRSTAAPVKIRVATTAFKSSAGVNAATARPYQGLNDLLQQHFNSSKVQVESTDIVGATPNDTMAKIQTLLLGGQVDIVIGATLWPYYVQGLLKDLTPYYKRSDWRSKFIATIFKPPIERVMFPPWVPNPTTYVSVPIDLSCISTAYDKQIFKDFGVEPLSEPPQITDIVAKIPKLTGKNPRTGKQTYGLYYNAASASHQLLYFLGHGDIDFGTIDPSNPSKIQFDTPLIMSKIEQMISLAKYSPPGFVLGQGGENWGTTDNDIAINLTVTPSGLAGAGMLTAVENHLTSRFVVTTGIRDKNNHTFYVSADEAAMASKTAHPAEAWKALQFLSGPVAQKFYFENFQALPGWKSQNWATKKTSPYVESFLATANNAHEAFFPEFMFQTFRPWLNATMSNTIAGKSVNLSSGLAEMQQQAEAWVKANYTMKNGEPYPIGSTN